MQNLALFIFAFGLCIFSLNQLFRILNDTASSWFQKRILKLSKSRWKSSFLGFFYSILLADNFITFLTVGSFLGSRKIRMNAAYFMIVWSIVGEIAACYLAVIDLESPLYLVMGVTGVLAVALEKKWIGNILRALFFLSLVIYAIALLKVAFIPLKDLPLFHSAIGYLENSFFLIILVSLFIKLVAQSYLLAAFFALVAVENGAIYLEQLPIWLMGISLGSVITTVVMYLLLYPPFKQLSAIQTVFYLISFFLLLLFSLFDLMGNGALSSSLFSSLGYSSAVIVINFLILVSVVTAMVMGFLEKMMVRWGEVEKGSELEVSLSSLQFCDFTSSEIPNLAIEQLVAEQHRYLISSAQELEKCLNSGQLQLYSSVHAKLTLLSQEICRFVNQSIPSTRFPIEMEHFRQIEQQQNLFDKFSCEVKKLIDEGLRLPKDSDAGEIFVKGIEIAIFNFYQAAKVVESGSLVEANLLQTMAQSKDEVMEEIRKEYLLKDQQINYSEKLAYINLSFQLEQTLLMFQNIADSFVTILGKPSQTTQNNSFWINYLSRMYSKYIHEYEHVAMHREKKIPKNPIILRFFIGTGLIYLFSLINRFIIKTTKKRRLKEFAFTLILSLEKAIHRFRHLSLSAVKQLGIVELKRERNFKRTPYKTITEATGSNFGSIASIQLLSKNSEDFEKRLKMIESAQKRITISLSTLYQDEVGSKFVDQLIAKREEGVEVLIALDLLNVHIHCAIDSTYRNFLDQIVLGGIELYLLSYKWDKKGSHRKAFVVDGDQAVVGGRNIGNLYQKDQLSAVVDHSFYLKGSGVEQLEQEIYKIAGKEYFFTESMVEEEEVTAAFVDHQANYRGEDKILNGVIGSIVRAEVSVDLVYGYFTPPSSLIEAIKGALKRGVKVRIITNSITTVDQPYWGRESYQSLQALFCSGAEVYLMKESCLHSKFSLFDKKISCVGSHNMWPFSHYHDCENNAFICSDELGENLTLVVEKLQEKSKKIVSKRELTPPSSILYRLANVLYGCRQPHIS